MFNVNHKIWLDPVHTGRGGVGKFGTQETEPIAVYWSVHTALLTKSKDLHAKLGANVFPRPV